MKLTLGVPEPSDFSQNKWLGCKCTHIDCNSCNSEESQKQNFKGLWGHLFSWQINTNDLFYKKTISPLPWICDSGEVYYCMKYWVHCLDFTVCVVTVLQCADWLTELKVVHNLQQLRTVLLKVKHFTKSQTRGEEIPPCSKEGLIFWHKPTA